MTTFLYTHPACLEHDPGRHHPESPARLRAVLAALDDPEFAGLERREAPEAALGDLERVHPRRHVERILGAVPKSGHVGIDADTLLSPASGAAALRAAGAVVAPFVVDRRMALMIAGIALLIVLRHHPNIRRLMTGTESRISFNKG